MSKLNIFKCFIGFFCFTNLFAQGPYAPGVGEDGTKAVYKDFFAITGWATACELQRGFEDIASSTMELAASGSNTSAVGAVDGGVVSLGDSGVAILTFASPISNTLGADFAIFENSFDGQFLELAFVEVSSDGVNYYRFDAISLSDQITEIGTFGLLDPTNLYNLAGKYRGQYGTPFDLEELKGTIGLDVDNVTHVKIIDVVGTLADEYASHDSEGNKINDPYPTAFEQGGFDLDGVAVLGSFTGVETQLNAGFKVYPNPSSSTIYFSENKYVVYSFFNLFGEVVLAGKNNSVDVSSLSNGVYIISIDSQNIRFVKQ
jgi:hypothetical protein